VFGQLKRSAPICERYYGLAAGGFEVVAQKTSHWPGIKGHSWLGNSMGDDRLMLAIVTATLLLTGSVVVMLFWL
jgi:hypothetical protein